MMETRDSKRHLPLLLLMATITLTAILCELMPSGVLPQMSEAYGIRPSEAGVLVGAYAVASAICGIPLVSLTVSWDRKKLLTLLLAGFALSNLFVALAPRFELALVGRLLGGVCAGTLWPMITAYGMALVDHGDEGRAVTIIMSGITVGMSVGLPLMTWIGTRFGYRAAFFVLSASIALIAIACASQLPSVSGEARSKGNSPFTMLKNPGVRLVIVLTFLAVGANYGLYTFITNLVKEASYPGVATAQLFFGIGSVISVVITMKLIDRHLHLMVCALFASGVATMALFLLAHSLWLFHLAFLFWGLGFGSMSSIFQTATAHQVSEGTAVANALQSSSFNFSIMFGSTGAGFLLAASGVRPIVTAAFLILLLGTVIAALSRKHFI